MQERSKKQTAFECLQS